MKKILFIWSLYFFASICCSAQKPGAIFFFYDIKNPFINLPSLFTDSIFIDNFRYNSVRLYCADKITNEYYIEPSNNVKFSKTILAIPGTIAFVAIRHYNYHHISGYEFSMLTLTEFKDAYNHKKKLRNRMVKAGYKSIEDLISDYNIYEPDPKKD